MDETHYKVNEHIIRLIEERLHAENPLENFVFMDEKRTLDVDKDNPPAAIRPILNGVDDKYQDSVLCFLGNVCYALELTRITGLNKYTAVSLRSNEYTGTQVYYPHFTYSKVPPVMDYFEGADLIGVHPGYFDRDIQKGKRTRIIATDELKGVLEEAELLTKSAKPVHSVIYRAKKKRYYKPRNKKEHRRMCARLDRINRENTKHTFEVLLPTGPGLPEDHYPGRPDLDTCSNLPSANSFNGNSPGYTQGIMALLVGTMLEGTSYSLNSLSTITDTFLDDLRRKQWIFFELWRRDSAPGGYVDITDMMPYRRIFKYSPNLSGGRFYNWAQLIPKVIRRSSLIDGEPTAGFDFSGMLYRMLYAEKGIDYPDDPYVIPGYERDIVKKAAIIAINASSIVNAAESRELRGLEDRYQLLRLIRATHYQIDEYFYDKRVGMRMQFKDSRVAERVMLYFAKIREGLLATHDGFRVRAALAEELLDVMRRAYKKEIGFYPVIDEGD
jgi:hypothetical protein